MKFFGRKRKKKVKVGRWGGVVCPIRAPAQCRSVGRSHEDFFFLCVLVIFFVLFGFVKQKVLSLFVSRKRCTLRTILNEEDEECFVDSVQRAGGYFFKMTDCFFVVFLPHFVFTAVIGHTCCCRFIFFVNKLVEQIHWRFILTWRRCNGRSHDQMVMVCVCVCARTLILVCLE